MKEKHFQTEFKNNNTLYGCFELKLCKGKSLPFSAVADHQIKALLAVKSPKGLYHKLTDQPVSILQENEKDKKDKKKDKKNVKMRFTRPKPFDCFYLGKQDAYIVVMFYVPRKKKNVYYIDIDDFLRMKKTASRKSFTEEMALKVCRFQKNYLKHR
ncbi:hypothetical protein DRH14_03040 [Candidatus Shapirobacteria bacterium]|nr:MAG: hypothetical protein DRH14_03040 [Candidatus Shapirobacteria bacterium]